MTFSTKEEAWLRDEKRASSFSLVMHLALRRSAVAMTELARLLEDNGCPADPFSSYGFARRAYRLGDPTAAYNLAMSYFNCGDLRRYREWIKRAAHLGDPDAKRQAKRFEFRLPHGAAHDIRRGRPYRSTD